MKQKQLVRNVKRAALTRMEDAARTEKDFKVVIKQWDKLDENRERRERHNEISRPNEGMLHWDRPNENDEKGKMKSGLETVIPRPLEHPWWRQHIRGDFIDIIFDCPHELHELVTNRDISLLLRDLSENHKEILYYSAIRQYSNVRIAALRKQSDRNIRKTLARLLKNLRTALDSPKPDTSQASFYDGDNMPEHTTKAKQSFSGKRIHRGMYRAKSGQKINADINGAANILKKWYDYTYNNSNFVPPASFRELRDTGIAQPMRLKP